MRKIFSFIIMCIPILAGCQEKKKPAKLTMDELIEINRQLVNEDMARIKNYANEHHLDLQATETGLWYSIKSNKKNPLAQKGQVITLKFTVTLLDGTFCYSSDKKKNPRIFRIGQGGVESGLEEAALMLRKGDKGKFIMPPHLAYGLTGDNNRIPPRATIIYDVEVIDIQ